MKILIVTPAYIPDWSKGGSVTGCHEFSKTCKEAYFDVTVSTLDTCNIKKYKENIDGIKILRFKFTKLLNGLAKTGFGVSLSWLFWFFKNAKHFELIYFRSIWNFTSLIGPIYCYLIKKKFGFCASGKLSKYSFLQSKRKKLFALFFLKNIFKKASFIHFATLQEKEEQTLQIFKNKKGIILPPSVLLPKKIVTNKNLKFYSVSRIHPTKNLEYIFENFPEINSTFVQYGEINKDDKYFKFINSIKKQRTVKAKELCIFGGYASKDDLDKIYGLGSVFIISSNSEGLSNAALEALSRGSLVIASRGSRMKDYIKSGGLIEINCDMGEELVKTIKSLNYNDVKEMGKKGSAFMAKYQNRKYLAKQLIDQLNF